MPRPGVFLHDKLHDFRDAARVMQLVFKSEG